MKKEEKKDFLKHGELTPETLENLTDNFDEFLARMEAENIENEKNPPVVPEGFEDSDELAYLDDLDDLETN